LEISLNNDVEMHGDMKVKAIDLIEESKSEVLKKEPNRNILKSFFSNMASLIQTCASLKPAYDALKTVLLPIGITLPDF